VTELTQYILLFVLTLPFERSYNNHLKGSLWEGFIAKYNACQ
jgi:hypothetical protein